MATFEVIYQPAKAETGVTVQVDVYKPDKTQDVAQSGTATEVGTTGRYYKSFTVDAPGWFVEVSDNKGGKAVKHWDKDAYDACRVVDLIADVQTAVDNIATAITALDTLVTGVDGKVDGIDTNVTDIKTVTDTLTASLSAISDKIDELGSPPMIG